MKNCLTPAVAGLLSLAALLPQPVAAQGDDLPAINRNALEARLEFLASDALQGREAGKQGGRVAAEYLRAELREAGIAPFGESYFQPFEAYSPAREKGADFQVHPDSIAAYRQLPAYRCLPLQNVIGYIEGERRDEYIVAGAHFDHLGVDELLVGDRIYNGADDNASGVAVLLEVAKAFAASGKKPLRSIIFAFWDGEEVNYLGSEYFVLHFAGLSRIHAYVNLDMIGRQGFVPTLYPAFGIPEDLSTAPAASAGEFHVLYSRELSPSVAGWLPPSSPYRPVLTELPHGARGGDYLSFSLREVPFVWFFTGLHPDYHTPQDEASTLDRDKLQAIAEAFYRTLAELSAGGL
jgi:Zn-dependent M28 family amino/carboxypeptidase